MDCNILRGMLTPKNQRIVGNLNIYTMETGDGREIELTLLGDAICWRRVGDISWIPLVDLDTLRLPFNTLIDQLLEESEATREIAQSVRDDADQHKFDGVGIKDISCTGHEGLVDIYTITLDDGRTFEYRITNASLDEEGLTRLLDQYFQESSTELKDKLDKNYVHIQRVSASVWHIQHNLNKHPSTTIVDSAGSIVVGEVTHIDENNLLISFSGEFSGKCYCN